MLDHISKKRATRFTMRFRRGRFGSRGTLTYTLPKTPRSGHWPGSGDPQRDQPACKAASGNLSWTETSSCRVGHSERSWTAHADREEPNRIYPDSFPGCEPQVAKEQLSKQHTTLTRGMVGSRLSILYARFFFIESEINSPRPSCSCHVDGRRAP